MKQRNLTHLVLGVILGFSSGSCGDPLDDLPTETAQATVEFRCQILPTEDSTELVQYQLILVLDQSQEVPLDTLPICEPIPAEQFASLDIPASALTAAGGFWAGNGEYYYLRQEREQTIVLAYGWQDDAQQAARVLYQPVRRIILEE